MTLPLDCVPVGDLTQVRGDPFCTMQLGDIHVDVSQVEPSSCEFARSVGVTQDRSGATFRPSNQPQ
jgi:crotonobetainyl-CoA:carnitine CoA-transferase CaiB-like acyl-CoA transferase